MREVITLLGGQNRILRYGMWGHCGGAIGDGPVALYSSDQYIEVYRLLDKRLILECWQYSSHFVWQHKNKQKITKEVLFKCCSFPSELDPFWPFHTRKKGAICDGPVVLEAPDEYVVSPPTPIQAQIYINILYLYSDKVRTSMIRWNFALNTIHQTTLTGQVEDV